MKAPHSRTVKLDMASRLEMLEMVQTALAHVAQIAGFDEDATHYMSVAVREAVVNAMKHGNATSEDKRAVDLSPGPEAARGERPGPRVFHPEPTPRENLLSQRRDLLHASFMDEVSYISSRGGTLVKMVAPPELRNRRGFRRYLPGGTAHRCNGLPDQPWDLALAVLATWRF
jgi:anti-sigma regulatory factor (Ser/Thr protein kinase)